MIKLSSETLGLIKDLYKSFVKDVVIIYKTASAALISAEKIAAKAKAEAQNVFLTWKHLNNIGEVVSLIKCEVISDGVESVLTYDGKTVYEYGGNSVLVLNIIVSENLNDYIDESNRELVVDSLKKSITNCSNLKFESVNLILQETD